MTGQQLLAALDTITMEAPAGIHADVAQWDQESHADARGGGTSSPDDKLIAAIVVWDSQNCPSS